MEKLWLNLKVALQEKKPSQIILKLGSYALCHSSIIFL